MLLSDYEARIIDAYDRLGHELGWRFLACPAAKLSADSRLAFVGLNPGGSVKTVTDGISNEAGNAYLVESWGPQKTKNTLQIQVRRMYEAIISHLPLSVSAESLMDQTLAANVCPFRSPSWDALPRRRESLAFSQSLWADVLADAHPKAIVCLGQAHDVIRAALIDRGARELTAPEVRPVGWGAYTYTLSRVTDPAGDTLLVKLPHLSRFTIFGRHQSREATDRIARSVAEVIA